MANINISEVLKRADVIWHDNPITLAREVKSRNKENPLTEIEKQTIKRIRALRMIPGEIEFK